VVDRLAGPGADDVIATVAGQPIRSADLERRTTALRHGPRGRHIPPDGGSASGDLRRWIVRELVTESVLIHEARAAGIIEPDDRTSALTPDVVGLLVDRATSTVAVDEAVTRAYYDRNPDQFRSPETRRIHHLVLHDEAEARRVARALAAEAAADPTVAGSTPSGLTSKAARVEPARDLRRGELVGPVEDAVFGAALGQVVGPIRTDLGWHVARIDVVVDAGAIPYDEARPAIEADLLADARVLAFESWLAQRRAALAVVEPDFEHPAGPSGGPIIHRH
jgi:hypothetical protein